MLDKKLRTVNVDLFMGWGSNLYPLILAGRPSAYLQQSLVERRGTQLCEKVTLAQREISYAQRGKKKQSL